MFPKLWTKPQLLAKTQLPDFSIYWKLISLTPQLQPLYIRGFFKVQGAALECMQCRPDVRLDVYDWLILSKPWGQSAQSAISWCADIHSMALRQARSPKQERVKTMENIFCIERKYKTIVSVVWVLTEHIPLPSLCDISVGNLFLSKCQPLC